MSNEFEQMGFVYLSTYDKPGRRANNDDHSPEYKTLRAAIDVGEVEGIQLKGSKRLMVRKASADEFLARQATSKVARPQPRNVEPAAGDRRLEDAVIALCRIDNGIALMQATLERLTAAVESMATQPNAEPAGTWRDMNGESL